MSDPSILHAPGADRAARVLLVVDSPTTSTFARALLQRWGRDVIVTPSGDRAQKALGNGTFELVIVDAASPDAPNIVAQSTVPVIALRAGQTELPGATAYCGLPFVIDSFRATVEACLAGADTAAADVPDVDTDEIIDLWGSLDDSGFLTVLAVFLIELRDRLATIDTLLGGGSRETLEREAHSIKGAASNVGAAAIRAHARRLEARAKAGTDSEIYELAQALRVTAQHGILALEAIIQAGRHR